LYRHRIAVLPFENFGNDPANAAFASGVHDTLITQIAKVPGLSVISRSSVLRFEGSHPTIREVADALHVGAVLEGSVARDRQRLRVQAQLIDAATDEHLWAETYDRDSGDLFAVQTEIAQAVATQLRIRLASGDAKRMAANLTSKPEAYERYVLGRSHAARHDWEPAIVELTAAVTLDSEFAAAFAQLSMAHTWLGFEETTKRKDALPLARDEAARALELDPTLPEAHLAQAVYLYRGDRDIERSAAEFELAIAGLPNDAQALQNFGFLRRWQGRWEEGAALIKRAAELDPGGFASVSAASTLAGLGRRKEANAIVAAGLAARPDNVTLALLPATVSGDMDCDLATEEAILAVIQRRFPDAAEPVGARWFFAWTTGDSAAAVQAAEQFAVRTDPGDDSVLWRQATARLAAGDSAGARVLLGKSLSRALAELNGVAPGDQKASALAWIALHYSLMGDHERAVDHARQSLREMPPEGAKMQRTDALLFDAVVLGRAGDMAAAEPLLRELLSIPAPLRAKGVWCDPLFAPLRTDARFRSLMKELGADTSVDPTRRETWPRPSTHESMKRE
jgi:TolB-like protein/Tfp pilus assembly protein PilF